MIISPIKAALQRTASFQGLYWFLTFAIDDPGRKLRVVCIGASVSGITAGIRIPQKLGNQVELNIYEKNPGKVLILTSPCSLRSHRITARKFRLSFFVDVVLIVS